jgi:hypothetical protein
MSGEQHPGGCSELEHDAIGFRDALVIGLASTAPAYSLAAGGPSPVSCSARCPHKLLHRSSVPVLVVPMPDAR